MYVFPNLAAQPSGVERMSSSRACKSAAVIDKLGRTFDVPFPSELVQGRDVQPVRLARVQSVREQQFVQFAGLGTDGPVDKPDALRQLGLIAQQQADECFLAFSGGVGRALRDRRPARGSRRRPRPPSARRRSRPRDALSRAAPNEQSRAIIGWSEFLIALLKASAELSTSGLG